MAKIRSPISVTALIVLLSLLSLIPNTTPTDAASNGVKWSRVNIPTEGKAGNWVLARGSDIQHLTLAADGTVYCYANPEGTSYTLFKSTDAGYSWSHIGRVEDDIVDIATAPDNADIIYYATESSIYKSTDGGASFISLPPEPGGAGNNNITITDIDVTCLDNSYAVIVSTRDTDESQYGGVYFLDEQKPQTGWINMNIGNYDVCTAVFSPDFTVDQQVAAVVTDEDDTRIITRIGDTAWDTIIGDAIIQGMVSTSAAIAFPEDHDATTSDYVLFVAIDTDSNKGDVYKINATQAPGSSTATDLNIGANYHLNDIDVSGLAISGSTHTASLLAGAANSNQVYISTDGGNNWTRGNREPTGQSRTSLLMAPDFSASGIAYAATVGKESAFSCTEDGGITWNQRGLIDTSITKIVDLSPSPNYQQDDTLFMITFGGKHSLWRSQNGGIKWERVITTIPDSINRLDFVELSPQYANNNQILYLAGSGNGNPSIWKSDNNGQSFKRRSSPFAIHVWTIVDDDTLFIGSHNGDSGLVCHTGNGGLSYSAETVVGDNPLSSIALSPDYEQDETILIGNTNGQVYWSNDNGGSFEQLPADATSPPLTDSTTVAFDPDYSSSGVIYAASDTPATSTNSKRIQRFTIGKSDSWESIDGTVPIGGILSGLTVSEDGVLYAINSQPVDVGKRQGGMERSTNPDFPLNATFETVTHGLDEGVKLKGLWLRGNQMWSIDTKNIRLMTYTDTLSHPVTLTSPLDKASGTDTRNINLDWEALKGATGYEWQLDYDADFSHVPDEFHGDTQASSVRLPVLEMGTTYYWRVRASEPVLSPWSDKWSFTTSLGTEVIAAELYSPKAGASDVLINPVFQWSAIAGADNYELLVSTDASFTNPIITRVGDYALPATAWQSDISLDYNTTYYWKVRASNARSYSAWSAVGAFTTESPSSESSPPEESSLPSEIASPSGKVASSPPAPPPPLPPAPSASNQDFPDLAIYIVGILLVVIILLLVTLLVMVTRTNRP